MPLTPEGAERKRDYRWLWLLAAPPTALLILVTYSCFTPVVLHVGDRWAVIGGGLMPPSMARVVKPGLHSYLVARSLMVFPIDPLRGEWVLTDPYRGGGFNLGRFAFSVSWFRGRRIAR